MKHIDRTMRRSVALSAAAAAIGLAFAPVALSADRDTRGSGGSAATTPAASKNQQVSVREIRMSRLIGMDVHNAAGRDIGEINDVIVDANNGRVQYAVLAFGGFMGLGEKLFAFPLSSFRAAADRDRLVLNIPEERLKSSPGFERNNWPDWNAPDYRGSVDKYYGARDERVQNARFVRGSELLEAGLRAKAGNDDIGDIEDVVVDLRTGRVNYIVAEFDRGWFTADKLVALPMRAFDPIKERKLFGNDLVLNVDKAKLANAPAFARDQWPDAPAFRRDVDRYSTGMGWGGVYGPYDDRNRPATGPATTGPATTGMARDAERR